jgi:beta-galactosidase
MEASARPTLDRAGLRLNGELVPLFSGSVHYWRLPRSVWKPALDALKNLGARLVDTYVPWSVHETAPGSFDFGERDPRLDVRHFLRLARDAGLYAIVRPGPHINSELTHFGIPERVIWDDACQAQSAARGRVVLPIPPLAFPVPSYTSAAFHREARTWLRAAGEQIAPLVWPEGPVVLVQIDNEGSLYFRDGPYDQDYHPDAIAQYRRYLRNRYSSVTALRAAHGDPSVTFDTLEPPPELDAKTEDELPRHLDWAEFQESAIEAGLYRFANVLKDSGLRRLPTFHNFPLAESATPLDAVRIEHAVDFVALDYYHHASDRVRNEIARRTTNLAARAAVRNVPAFGAEMGAGFAPYFPPLSDADNHFAVLNALAYGLRGFNLYMAVSRDRWIGGPIDRTGVPRPSAEFWKSLFAALERTRFYELVRRTPVRVIVPRSLERLARVVHAFEAVPPTAFALGGRGASLGSFENDLDPTHGAVMDAESFLTTVEQSLDEARVPYAVVREDQLASPPPETRWTIVVCPGALDTALTTTLGERMMRSTPLSVGPRPPERDGSMRPSRARLPNIESSPVPAMLPLDPAALRAAVGTALGRLEVATLQAEPRSVHTTMHHDKDGHARVLFVINASEEPVEAVAHAPGARGARDALTLERVLVTGEHVVLPVPAFSVRMLELSLEP